MGSKKHRKVLRGWRQSNQCPSSQLALKEGKVYINKRDIKIYPIASMKCMEKKYVARFS